MTEQSDLERTVLSLIDRRSEGVYWDFKREHHQDTDDDLLCLANAKHEGDRFLILGVDGIFSLHSIKKKTPKRRTQAEIATLLRDNADKFFQSRFPEVYMQALEIRETPLDVIVIKEGKKPYYLVKRLRSLPPHHIYTRVCDTNTPKNETA